MAMPMAYGTLIGDMGSALSGGQQQRLLLARALYQQPAILILDEATSHLDVATEQKIAAMLAELRMTRVFAAHRPDTVAIADRVISLGKTSTTETRRRGERQERELNTEVNEEEQRKLAADLRR